MPNGPFPWFNPQTLKIQDHHLPINLPTIFMLTSIYFVTFFERSLSGWKRAAFQSKVVRGCLGIDLLQPISVLSVNMACVGVSFHWQG
jgi:ABC-type uncharacterized transport system permease subunit